MNYMMHSEISQISETLKALNGVKNLDPHNWVTFGAFAVYDSNGETVGYIAMCENTEYAFYPGDVNPEIDK